MSRAPLLQVEGLSVCFPVRRGPAWGRTVAKVVDGVSFELDRGETLGLVGESGCGKTTTALALLRLREPAAGRVLFQGRDVTAADAGELRRLRRRMGFVFQDPYASLNPRMRIGDLVAEPLVIQGLGGGRRGRSVRVAELLDLVGLSAAATDAYPHELSGGQRQRVGIARALAADPDLLICDEPVASLDVSIQAQILNLLVRLQEELGLTYLFISHDLAAVQHMSDRVAVMYLGRIVESAAARDFYRSPQHPYSRALLSAIPKADPAAERARRRILLKGPVPSPVDPPAGCRFHTRCPEAFEPCDRLDPPLRPVDGGQLAACHLHGIIDPSGDA